MSKVFTAATLVAGLAAAGALTAPATASAPAHAKPTSLTLKAAHASVAPKHKDTLTATLKSGHTPVVGATVSLEKRAAGSSKFGSPVALPAVTDSKGQVAVPVTPGNKAGQKEQYQLTFAGTSAYKASHSQVITVTVTTAG